MRIVLDTSVYVAGILNPNGGSGETLRLWREEALFEVIASNQLFDELLETLHKPCLQGHFEPNDPGAAISSLAKMAELWADEPEPPSTTRDVKDDYLVSLSLSSNCDVLVTLDNDLLVLGHIKKNDGNFIPIIKPGDLLAWLRDAGLR